MIPYGRHNLGQDDIEAVVDVLKGDWLTCGPAVEKLESELSILVGAEYVVLCSNGTTALHLALIALGVDEGDVVLVPAITFLATANVVRYLGAEVVFVDVDPSTGLMTADSLEDAILKSSGRNLKAVINVHLAGQCENLEAIFKVAKKHKLLIVDDAAHAIGTSYVDSLGKCDPIGSNVFCDLTTFSFHPVKTIAMGEGGAITTNNKLIAAKLKQLRSHGMIRESKLWTNQKKEETQGLWYYEMQELGFNYRLSDIHCALGISQLKKLSKFKKIRSDLVGKYDQYFTGVKKIRPLRKLKSSDAAWHLYILFLDFDNIAISREDLVENLKKDGIGTQVHYIPVYKQPYYRKLYGEIELSGAELYYKACLSLPLYVGLTPNQQEKVVNSVLKYVE